MKKITKRDVLFFIAGMFLMLVIEAIYDWDSAKKGFMKGFNQATGQQEQTK